MMLARAGYLRRWTVPSKEDYEGKDGLVRDYYKLRYLGVGWREAMAPHWVRFRNARGIVEKAHTFTNLLTEGGRASPYYFGHVVVWPIIGYGAIVTGFMLVHFINQHSS